MNQKIDITLDVNGRRHDIRVEARRTLADALRDDCGLGGVHSGCEHGVCGTCTIAVDGEPVRACLMFAIQARGTKIVTVEGLADGEKLHPLQRAFMEHHALQCGYCTPGFLMLAWTVLAKSRDTTLAESRDTTLAESRDTTLAKSRDISDEELVELVSSNLCRCTGYRNILRAIRAAAAEMRKP